MGFAKGSTHPARLFRQPADFSRHCEPTGGANARPMTGSAKQSISRQDKCGLLTWGLGVSRRLVSSLFDWRPALRPDRGSMEMARADRVKAGPQGRREAAWP